MLRREDCWALLIEVILMSPPRRTTLSLGSQYVATISFPNASRAVMDICLKLGPSSVVLSMTGVKLKSGSRGLLEGWYVGHCSFVRYGGVTLSELDMRGALNFSGSMLLEVWTVWKMHLQLLMHTSSHYQGLNRTHFITMK